MSLAVTYGRKAVRELLDAHPETIHRLAVVQGRWAEPVRELVARARAAGIPVQIVPRKALDRLAGDGVHQGVVAETTPVATRTLGELLGDADLGAQPILVACDGVTDPHNLGAIARSAAGAGAVGLLVPARQSAPLSGVVRKAAAGALERLPVARVPNLAQALQECADKGWWIVGTAADGDTPLDAADLVRPLVLVVGSEQAGLRPGVRKHCDLVLAIPLAAGVESLNVSVAAGVVLFEAVRQRRVHAARRADAP